MLRQPIVSVLGHVDHGKTTLLDTIRGSGVAAKEAGGITQHIGATEFPQDSLRKIVGPLLQKFKLDIKIPGLLFIDTPGHEAFTTLRKRGGSIADLAILVVDINEGFMPQTVESLNFLKQFKTPFVIAANKIDAIEGWRMHSPTFLEDLDKQSSIVKQRFDEKLYSLMGQISEKGFETERYDQIKDFTKQIAIVPCAGRSGEGVPDLLLVLAGLAQTFLKGRLEIDTKVGKGAILEMKEVRGLGLTADCVIYDGECSVGDNLVVGGSEPFITKIKVLLKPAPLKEMRVEKQFNQTDKVTAAAGVKISAPDLEKAKAGASIRITKDPAEAKRLLVELQKEKEEVEFNSDEEGVIVKADTLGGLEALVKIFSEHVPIRKAGLGPVEKLDVMEAKSVKDPYKRVVLAFNVPVNDSDPGARVISNNIIYRILDDYKAFIEETKKKLETDMLTGVTRPAKFTIIPGFVFRANDPAVVGIEVNAGLLKPGVSLIKLDGKDAGTVKNIQSQSETLQEAKPGTRVAVSIDGPTVGRQIHEGEVLYTDPHEKEYKTMLKLRQVLSKSEWDCLEEIALIKRKADQNWGLY